MSDNEIYLQYFDWYLPNDGLWWRSVEAKAELLARTGFTGVWLPPAYKALTQDNVGYGVFIDHFHRVGREDPFSL